MAKKSAPPIRICTIGFTQTSAERFFTSLRTAGVKRVLDIRLRNDSQLAGFAKRDDLKYFLEAIGGIEYVHVLPLAPNPELFQQYRHGDGDWPSFRKAFLALMAERQIEKTLSRELFDGACLLCSEHEPHRCHRSLVAEYLGQRWGNVAVEHLGVA